METTIHTSTDTISTTVQPSLNGYHCDGLATVRSRIGYHNNFGFDSIDYSNRRKQGWRYYVWTCSHRWLSKPSGRSNAGIENRQTRCNRPNGATCWMSRNESTGMATDKKATKRSAIETRNRFLFSDTTFSKNRHHCSRTTILSSIAVLGNSCWRLSICSLQRILKISQPSKECKNKIINVLQIVCLREAPTKATFLSWRPSSSITTMYSIPKGYRPIYWSWRRGESLCHGGCKFSSARGM